MNLKSIRKLASLAMETTVEIIEKRKAWAFINNAIQIIDLGDELHDLKEEHLYLKENPELLEAIQDEQIKKYPKYENDIIAKTFRKVFAAILYNISTGLSIAEDWKEYNETK